jgi:hypothetical protein
LKEEDPEEFEQIKTGNTTLSQVKRKKKEQKREARRGENRAKVAEAPAADVAASGAQFATIVIDPPWDWGDEGDVDQMGRAKPDYATLTIDQLLNLPVAQLADTDCHLYLWITNRSLPKGFPLIERWGFRYITALTWLSRRSAWATTFADRRSMCYSRCADRKVYVARMLERYFLRHAANVTAKNQSRSMNWLSPVVRGHTLRCSVGQRAVIGRCTENAITWKRISAPHDDPCTN